MNATRSPTVMCPAITCRPPSHSTTSEPTPPTIPMTGVRKPRTPARRTLCSWKRAFTAAKAAISRASLA